MATSEVQAFIQNVHHFRDECLVDAADLLSSTSLFLTRRNGRGISADGQSSCGRRRNGLAFTSQSRSF